MSNDEQTQSLVHEKPWRTKAVTLLLAPPIIFALFGGFIGLLVGHIAPEHYGAATASIGRRVGAGIGLGQGVVGGAVLGAILLSIFLVRSADSHVSAKRTWPRYLAVSILAFVAGGLVTGYIGWQIGYLESVHYREREATTSTLRAVNGVIANGAYPLVTAEEAKYSVLVTGVVNDQAQADLLRRDIAQALGEAVLDRVDWSITIAAPDRSAPGDTAP